ncbi:MAG: thioredoxin domain-containing protein, partial [Gammaproteobacteria bacterium]
MNALSTETSPYLLQHADNPVAWYPWSERALQLARTEDKPILLSIGYSACHWCHVMARESFEDEATARLMNELFVNIKVDREERPDLDKIYQVAHHLLTSRNGGWPLTVFLTPHDHTPVFAGTYFPPAARHGLPSFQDVLISIARAYRERHGELREQQRSLRAALQRWAEVRPGNDALDAAPLNEAREELRLAYDGRYGGFGGAPKFPHPPSLERLLRHHAASLARDQADAQALDMALATLEHMALGGLYDQLGGGFCRYSVDERWLIP